MSLPQVNILSFDLKIPSSKKSIKFRPFKVTEEKELLMIKNTEDEKEMMNGMKTIIENCTFGKVEAETLSTFDIEYIFLNIRAKSIGEKVDLIFQCENCERKIDVNIDLTKAKIIKPKGHKKTFIMKDGIGFTLRYPNIIKDYENQKDPITFVASLIESVFDKDSVYPLPEIDEVIEWVNDLPGSILKEVEEKFFKKMPYLELKFSYTCPECKKKMTKTIKGITDFF